MLGRGAGQGVLDRGHARWSAARSRALLHLRAHWLAALVCMLLNTTQFSCTNATNCQDRLGPDVIETHRNVMRFAGTLPTSLRQISFTSLTGAFTLDFSFAFSFEIDDTGVIGQGLLTARLRPPIRALRRGRGRTVRHRRRYAAALSICPIIIGPIIIFPIINQAPKYINIKQRE